MEAYIDVTHIDDFCLTLCVNLIKFHESNTYTIATFVRLADRIMIVEDVVIGFIAFRLFVV